MQPLRPALLVVDEVVVVVVVVVEWLDVVVVEEEDVVVVVLELEVVEWVDEVGGLPPAEVLSEVSLEAQLATPKMLPPTTMSARNPSSTKEVRLVDMKIGYSNPSQCRSLERSVSLSAGRGNPSSPPC
jgi:hypothetical protein